MEGEELTLTADPVESSVSTEISTTSESAPSQEITKGDDVLADQPTDTQAEPLEKKQDDGTTDYRSSVSGRIRAMVKESPEFGKILEAHPKFKEEIEARFRRDMAYRELFPTVSEARALREEIPNGIEDIKAMQGEIIEFRKTDNNFYTADREGNYPGHTEIINNLFNDDRKAAVSLFKTLPKEWARLDRDSYNEVMGQVIGSTIMSKSEMLDEMIDLAEADKSNPLAQKFVKLYNWMSSFTREKQKPSEAEERLGRDRKDYESRRAEDDKKNGEQFQRSFVAESMRLQKQIIVQHPAIKKIIAAQNLDQVKKDAIVEQVRSKIEKFLGRSPSFMSKLRPAYEQRNLNELINTQRAGWSQPWLMNRFVREVLNKEVPQIVSSNRDAARRAGAPVKKNTITPGDKKDGRPTKPYQENGRWYWPSGKAMSSVELLAGKHEAA